LKGGFGGLYRFRLHTTMVSTVLKEIVDGILPLHWPKRSAALPFPPSPSYPRLRTISILPEDLAATPGCRHRSCEPCCIDVINRSRKTRTGRMRGHCCFNCVVKTRTRNKRSVCTREDGQGRGQTASLNMTITKHLSGSGSVVGKSIAWVLIGDNFFEREKQQSCAKKGLAAPEARQS
jgi:hypothetical protein